MSRERTRDDNPDPSSPTAADSIDSVSKTAVGVASDLIPLLFGPDGPDIPVLPDRADRLAVVLEHMGAWFSEQDESGHSVYVSDSIQSVIGYAPEEAMQLDTIKIHPDDMPVMRSFSSSLGNTGRGESCRFRLQHKNGDWLWIELVAIRWQPHSSADGGLHTVSFNLDVTAQVEAAAALHESEERLRVVAELGFDMIVEVAADGRTTYLSPGGLDVLGYTATEMLSLPPFEIIHPDDRNRVKADLEKGLVTGQPIHFEAFRCRHADGQWLWLESTGLKFQRADGELRYLGVTRDITEHRRLEQERRELETRMQRAQKLEGLGVMAGGIAHDFNNLLTPILGAASLGLHDLPADSPVRAHLLRIQHAAQRAAELTNQMLSYSGKSPLSIAPMDLTKLVAEMGELLESTVSGKTRLQVELAPGLPRIAGDSAQVAQVVLNLITNAVESLPDGSGKIHVRTDEVEVDRLIPGALFADELSTGRHVFFEVADTGCGMDRDTVAKIFDPFFTTKFTGRGLGLAAVAGIVRSHRGAIEIDTEPGAGTVIRVLFPAATTQAAASASTPAAEKTTDSAWHGTGTVLLIDDDAGVRDLVEEMLGRVGLDVLCASDGSVGIDLFRDHADEIRLVLLDRTMPSECGREAYDKIRAIDPNANIALISGYTQERATADLAGQQLVGFLKKPFLPEQLIELVREVLDT